MHIYIYIKQTRTEPTIYLYETTTQNNIIKTQQATIIGNTNQQNITTHKATTGIDKQSIKYA